ncbi:MAG: AraC family transcriptional regulator [Chitinophagaceae bacterium]
MTSNIPYFENISESFQDAHLESISPDFELIHFEDIPLEYADHNKPFRLNAFVVGLFTDGEAVLTINSKDHKLKKGTLYFSTPWHIRHYTHINKWQGYLLFFTPQYLLQNHQAVSITKEFPFFQSENGIVISLSEKELRRLEKAFDEMYSIVKSDNTDRYRILYHYVNILLLQCKSLNCVDVTGTTGNNEKMITRFLEALNNYFTSLTKGSSGEALTMKGIAQQLHIHPNYLSNLVKAQSGKTVSSIIRDRLVLEAKALLCNSTMTVSEIAYHLQFSDTSNFAKFFKRSTGTTPTIFRLSYKENTHNS